MPEAGHRRDVAEVVIRGQNGRVVHDGVGRNEDVEGAGCAPGLVTDYLIDNSVWAGLASGDAGITARLRRIELEFCHSARTPEEHALGDAAKPFCKFCAGEDGSLKSYADVLASMAEFLRKTQGLDETVAREAAQGMLAKLPAWRGR